MSETKRDLKMPRVFRKAPRCNCSLLPSHHQLRTIIFVLHQCLYLRRKSLIMQAPCSALLTKASCRSLVVAMGYLLVLTSMNEYPVLNQEQGISQVRWHKLVLLESQVPQMEEHLSTQETHITTVIPKSLAKDYQKELRDLGYPGNYTVGSQNFSQAEAGIKCAELNQIINKSYIEDLDRLFLNSKFLNNISSNSACHDESEVINVLCQQPIQSNASILPLNTSEQNVTFPLPEINVEQNSWQQIIQDVLDYSMDIFLSLLKILGHVWDSIIEYKNLHFPSRQSQPHDLSLDDKNDLLKRLRTRKNFASKDSGATILHKSSGIQNPKAILSANQEEYLILPSCKEGSVYDIIVNLSEDVLVDTIVVTNNEDFSDILSSIEFYGSIDYPQETWLKLGSLIPQHGVHEHILTVELKKSQMIRYIKTVLKGQAGNELYCTLTSMRVYGQGMHVVMRNSLMDLESVSTTSSPYIQTLEQADNYCSRPSFMIPRLARLLTFGILFKALRQKGIEIQDLWKSQHSEISNRPRAIYTGAIYCQGYLSGSYLWPKISGQILNYSVLWLSLPLNLDDH